MVKVRKSPGGSLLSFMSALTPFKPGKIEKPETKATTPSKSSQWLLPFISTASYYDRCPKHENGDKGNSRLVYFCTECPDDGPLCNVCRKESHADHLCLKLSRCAKSSAVKDSQVFGIDLSDVYPYLANGEPVYFLRSDRARAASVRRCVVCQRPLFVNRKIRSTRKQRPRDLKKMVEDREGARYCSLLCKFQDILGIRTAAGSVVKNEVNDPEEKLSGCKDHEFQNEDNGSYSSCKPVVKLEIEDTDRVVTVKEEEGDENEEKPRSSPIKSFIGSFFKPFSKNDKDPIQLAEKEANSSSQKYIQSEDGISPGIFSKPRAEDTIRLTLTPQFAEQGNNFHEDNIRTAIEIEDDCNDEVEDKEIDESEDDDSIGQDFGELGLMEENDESTIEMKCNGTVETEENGYENENNELYSRCKTVEKHGFEDRYRAVNEHAEEKAEAASSNQCSLIKSFFGSIFKPFSKGSKGRTLAANEESKYSPQKYIESEYKISPGISSKLTAEDTITTAIKPQDTYKTESEHDDSVDGDNEDDSGDEDMGVLGLGEDRNLKNGVKGYNNGEQGIGILGLGEENHEPTKYQRSDALDIVPVGFLHQHSDQDQQHENFNPQSHQILHINVFHKYHTLAENERSSHGENTRSRSRSPAEERQIVAGGGSLVKSAAPLRQMGPVEEVCTNYREVTETFGGHENPLASITIDLYSPPYGNFLVEKPSRV